MRLQKVCALVLGLSLLVWGDHFVWGNRANAQDPQWAHKMFDKLEHDFGVVPSNADLKYRIKITNKYKETVHIAKVTPGCSCAAGKPSKDTLAGDETGRPRACTT